ncbi:uncharacterized protein [Ptychodera flava]|uniref:uncharacterized protein n=1 Tax=Ptychodera flava TaxID=63121 RepID=UPI00396A59FC
MTSEKRNQSYHFLNTYAVRDRINCEHLPDDNPVADILTLKNSAFLPTAEDTTALRSDFAMLICRMLVSDMKFFQTHFKEAIDDHIPHKYSDESKEKSELVPLGILMKNECITEECIDVLRFLHQYVPGASSNTRDTYNDDAELVDGDENVRDRHDSATATATAVDDSDLLAVSTASQHNKSNNPPSELRQERSTLSSSVNEVRESATKLKRIFCTGDQLSVERAVNGVAALADGQTPEDRLEGLEMRIADWHADQIFLQTIWSEFYSTSSAGDEGTLYHLRNKLDRRNVIKGVHNDINSVRDFNDIVLRGHIIAAAMQQLHIVDKDERPRAFHEE